MGYPVEIIGVNTQLFSVIGRNAIENKQDAYFNQFFQKMDADCKMMPLNIREDDLGFFLHGLKDSKIKAVYFEKEYWNTVYDLLDTDDEEVNFCGMCDTIDIHDHQYHMKLTQGGAIVNLMKDYINLDTDVVTIIGTSPSARSLLCNLINKSPKKIILAAYVIEDLLDMLAIIPDNIEHDVVRIQNNTIDASTKIAVNFTNTDIVTNADHVIDFNNNFDRILTKIAETKTKEWTNNG